MPENIFKGLAKAADAEFFEEVFSNQNLRIERIVSYGYASPESFWYNQPDDEWVILLSGNAELQFKHQPSVKLNTGDYIFIPANEEHRVSYVSHEPQCIWLAIHIKK